jgi:Concanavalin A-like lectin/glucanases superfamily
MKRLTFCMAVFATMALVGTMWAGKEKEEPQLRLELDLVDGSHVVGIPSIESVPVQTSYAKMDVALKQIMTIKIAEDHENASIDLRNGDKLKGVIILEPINLETVFGTVKIGVEHIRDVRVALSSGTLSETLRKGLVLYYSFDKDADGRATDLSDKGNDGTVIGSPVWVREGQRGGVYRMQAGRGSSIETKDSPVFSLKPDDDRTFCLWWKKDGNIQHKVLLSKWGEANAGLGFALLTLESERQYYLPFQNGHCAMFSAAFSDSAWNHVALVKSGTTWTVYHNGKNAPIARQDGWPLTVDLTVNTPLEIGGNMRDYGFEGFLDEVMIFDRALSPEEIKQIYDLQK